MDALEEQSVDNHLQSVTDKAGCVDISSYAVGTAFRKIDGNWLMVHDHVSVPLDPASGKALLDLEP